jgi:hypothetical protein
MGAPLELRPRVEVDKAALDNEVTAPGIKNVELLGVVKYLSAAHGLVVVIPVVAVLITFNASLLILTPEKVFAVAVVVQKYHTNRAIEFALNAFAGIEMLTAGMVVGLAPNAILSLYRLAMTLRSSTRSLVISDEPEAAV